MVMVSTSTAIMLMASLIDRSKSLSMPNLEWKRRDSINKIGSAIVSMTQFVPLSSYALVYDDQKQGISAITDSSIGRAFRRSIIQGARVADTLDGKWERLSDGLRDKSKCDERTGRRLYDNGVRKDGTPIGNPGLGALCNPVPLLPLKEDMAKQILNLALESAMVATGSFESGQLYNAIKETKNLVRPSFERSIRNSSTEDERDRGMFNFELYSYLRAIISYINETKAPFRDFQIRWGKALVSLYAPFATRYNYASPFPEAEDDLQDYDYDRNTLLDALGALQGTLQQFQAGGIIGSFEISIPADDYGSVVTVAIDDFMPIGAEILLQEQNFMCEGLIQAVLWGLLSKSKINCSMDTFFVDPTTTRQENYNPTQLLISMNNLRQS